MKNYKPEDDEKVLLDVSFEIDWFDVLVFVALAILAVAFLAE